MSKQRSIKEQILRKKVLELEIANDVRSHWESAFPFFFVQIFNEVLNPKIDLPFDPSTYEQAISSSGYSKFLEKLIINLLGNFPQLRERTNLRFIDDLILALVG